MRQKGLDRRTAQGSCRPCVWAARELVVTHRNLNDGTIEGVRHTTAQAASAQVSPKGSGQPARLVVFLRPVSPDDGVSVCQGRYLGTPIFGFPRFSLWGIDSRNNCSPEE